MTFVVFESEKGTFKAELFDDQMPITVGNIIDLIEQKYYDGLYIHRVAKDYCVQFGCPYAIRPYTEWTEDGDALGLDFGQLQGGEEEEGEDVGSGAAPPETTFQACNGAEHTRDEYGNIEDEFVKGLSNIAGTLSMANSGDPDTGGSQFFINVKDNTHLDWFNGKSESAHPVFGKIIEGYEEVIKTIEQVEVKAEQPVEPIKMISVRIEKK